MTRILSVLAGVVLLTALAACAGNEPAATPTPEAAPTAAIAPTPAATPTAATETQPGATVERGLEYALATFNGYQESLRLDMYVPADPAGAPIVITDMSEIVDELAQAGVIVVWFDAGAYPWDTEESILEGHGIVVRENAEEYACAMHLARARAAELGNPDPVVVLTGFSQGGGTVAHAALFGDTLEEAWDGFTANGGPPRQLVCEVPDGSTHADAVVGMSGAYDMYVPIYEGKYGLTYQQAHDPELQAFLASAMGANPDLKVRLIHGTRDDHIPLDNSTGFEAALADAGYDVQLATFDGWHMAPHDLSLATIMDVLGR
jgi:hypothetical protein